MFIHNFLRKIRLLIYKILPIKEYLKLRYFITFKRRMDINHPKRFSEKIYCLKYINGVKQKDLIKKCYDKYSVRKYIAEKNYDSLLNELYGVYDRAEDIKFDELPSKFVLKITQSSGLNIICPNKEVLNVEETIKKLNKWQMISNEMVDKDEEGYVFDGKAKIICEKYLEDKNGHIPEDIRVYCFNGEPKLFVCDFGTTDESGEHGQNIKRNVYDIEWNLIPIDLGRTHDENINMKKPDNLEEIIQVSRELAKDFIFVRVDLYNVDNQIVFGELTWIPMGGNCKIVPDDYDFILGDMLDIPDINNYIG